MISLLAAAYAGSPPIPDAELAIDRRLMAQVDDAGALPCLTPLLAELRAHWSHLSSADRAHATSILAPFRDDLFGDVESSWGVAPPPAADSCWSWSDNRLIGDHFVVEYEDGVDADDAQRFLEALDYSWGVEVEDYAWNQPDGSSKYLILAYIQDKNTGGAYTTVQSCGGSYVPYIVAGKDSWNDPTWGDTMAAHEFNHAIQFGYSYAPEFWWWEATATWVEDYVYPNANYWAQYVYGYTDNPYIALSASSQQDYDIFYHMYGMAIWAFYLDDYQGGHDAVQQTWIDAQGDRGQYSRGAEDMVKDLGLDWDTVYADFIARNTVMDYKQQRYYPNVDIHDTVRSLPADGSSNSKDEPEGYGQNYVHFEAGIGEGDLVVHFAGESKVEWIVELVETDTDVLRTELGKTTDGVLDLTLTDYGANDVYLVVSPDTDKDSSYSYDWTAELIATKPPEDTGTPDSGGADTGDGSGGGGNGDGSGSGDGGGTISLGGAGCGCSSAGGSAGIPGVLGVLAAVAGRRRR